MNVRIGYLYPNLMNIYGDHGNVITLVQRCRWRGIAVEVDELDVGDRVKPGMHDIFFIGGGQDREQVLVCRDLLEVKGEAIKREIEDGAAALAICGGYQLFGKFYRPFEETSCPGLTFSMRIRSRATGALSETWWQSRQWVGGRARWSASRTIPARPTSAPAAPRLGW